MSSWLRRLCRRTRLNTSSRLMNRRRSCCMVCIDSPTRPGISSSRASLSNSRRDSAAACLVIVSIYALVLLNAACTCPTSSRRSRSAISTVRSPAAMALACLATRLIDWIGPRWMTTPTRPKPTSTTPSNSQSSFRTRSVSASAVDRGTSLTTTQSTLSPGTLW